MTTTIARLACDQPTAWRLAAYPGESLDPEATACAAFEDDDGQWQLAVHFHERPDEASSRALVALAAGEAAAAALTIEPVAAADWVKQSLAGLNPVRAGRFIVHAPMTAPVSSPTTSASRSKPRSPSAPATTAPRAAACWRSTACQSGGEPHGCSTSAPDRRAGDRGGPKTFRTRVVASDIDRVAGRGRPRQCAAQSRRRGDCVVRAAGTKARAHPRWLRLTI